LIQGESELELQIGVSKVSKYASRESGDTVEVIERPGGGLSLVLVDGQRSGRSAKIISNIVARKAISLLGEGVRDGAVARAAHDYLQTHRSGQVSADLQLISADLQTQTLVISRNTRCPALCVCQGVLQVLEAESEPIGVHLNTKPVIIELPLKDDTYIVAYTDGLVEAGEHTGVKIDLHQMVLTAARDHLPAQELSDAILSAAILAESGRPGDDISIAVFCVLPRQVPGQVRRMSVSFPIQDIRAG
jgi:serine phosphatase RsbU (regulator of sigma subunit)